GDAVQCGGLLVTNPPYGVRLGDAEQLGELYRALGDFLKRECEGWQAAIFTGNPELGWSTGLRSWRQHKLFNGSIACQLQRYRIEPQSYRRAPTVVEGVVDERALGEGATMLANRLRKNRRKLKSWLAANPGICYRAYDADLPEYAVAIDCYAAVKAGAWGEGDGDSELYMHVQEYQAPASVDSHVATRRLDDVVAAVSCVFAVDTKRIVLKRRARQKGKQQYQKLDERAPDLLVREGGLRFKVNLGRYLDTGLFLDHRPVRALLRQSAHGGRFLNLFAYTSAATVYAASGGARSSISVDMSKTYIEWSRANFKLNGISTAQHQLVQADCLAWLQDCDQQFDCILLDPPSFSNSSRMSATLDIQRDHLQLIEACMQRLAGGGCLYFSNNRRGFKLSGDVVARFVVEDLTESTLDADFKRARPAHYCWRITHKAA
ncbi:MAG: bifunctional 23S rRNA (guanine(2069)-N(7))-methyltransferase RlmK/23S rRNA (guanine(2445)-N(2))-methyltransferase RlmL, partial [Gammaproteobacteria bacterium]|nr:bifunctional 23S rRNA (guanine(2069)-N(7))-methyltransferase RlmK/23S rRNA (guanine(2445)-N(2))-methyltransferase RlmL [Gammaproteobacteria bacterium]